MIDDPGTLTGRRHPQTSRAAATRALGRSGNVRRKVLATLTRYALTDEEMQQLLCLPANTQRPRRVELVDAGYVDDTGVTRTTSTGAQSIVWCATARGVEALAYVDDEARA